MSESMSVNEGCYKKGEHSANGVQKELIAALGRPTVSSLDLNQPGGLGCSGRVLVTRGIIAWKMLIKCFQRLMTRPGLHFRARPAARLN